jgi:toxin secretion/phage lysis holin
MDKWEIIHKIGSIGTGLIVGWFGGWSVLLQILFTLTIIDYLSGLLASGVEGKLSSKVGFRGIAKKIMIFVMVAVGHLIDLAIGQGSMIQDGIIFFYAGNEILSIIENAGRTGLPVPDQIKSAVDVLKGKSKGEGK